MTNNQKPEPKITSDGSTLDLHSIFLTIQGEGPFSGHRAIFVRLAGCNLQCPGCDTEYTQGRSTQTVGQIINTIHFLGPVNKTRGSLVVITGGEPLRQNISLLVSELCCFGYHVQIESNGMFEPDFNTIKLIRRKEVTLVISPKTQKINSGAEILATAYKYVLDHRSVAEDGLPVMALEHPASKGVARPPASFKGVVYLNPCDTKDEVENKKNLDAVTQSCLQHGHVLGLQVHKIIDLE